jgi:hypothetical protein
LLKKVAAEAQKVKQQELKNSESENDSMFYLFSMFFEFAVITHLFIQSLCCGFPSWQLAEFA